MPVPDDHPHKIAHKHSSNHRAEILRSSTCGCFYCLSVFSPEAIVRWVDNGQTAMCPKCGIDSVLGDASGLQIDRAFLSAMKRTWF